MSSQSREIVRKTYTADGGLYDDHRERTPRGILLSERDVDLVLRLIDERPVGRPALEVGAGTGRFTIPLLNRGCELIAVDINEAMLNELRKRLKECPHEAHCDVRNGDVFALDFEDHTFEHVFCFHVIPRFLNVADQSAALSELCRVLRPGGTLMFNFRNSRSPYNLVYRGHAVSMSSLRGVLEANGVRVTRAVGKHLLARKVLDRLPMLANRVVAWLDRALEIVPPHFGWDVFVVARKEC